MERKQLDFNAPLLSVRRFSLPIASSDGDSQKVIENSLFDRSNCLPLYKSDLELGEVTKPAAVPFMWEQIPGRPKGGSDARSQPIEESSNTPRLPPGRILDVIKQISEKPSDYQNVLSPQIEASSSNSNPNLLEILNKGPIVKGGSNLESGDDAYSKAPETLSPTESFSLNCSLSGLSRYDGPVVKPAGTLSTNPQTRNFMMSRFLPAAKAMVLASPLHVSRKQLVAPQQAKQVKKVVNGERMPFLELFRSNIVPHYDQCTEDVESEDEDDMYNYSDNKSAKACGLFLCLKNSLCPLNLVPGMKVRTQGLMSSASEVSRPTRTAFSGRQRQILEKHAWGVSCKKPSDSRVQSHELHEVDNKLISEFNQLTISSELHVTDGSSPYRRPRDGISPYRNEAPRSALHEGSGFLGVPKAVENVMANNFNLCNEDCINFWDVESHQRYKEGSGSMNPTVEKMLYIDSVNIVESISSGAKVLMDSSGKDFDTLVGRRGMEEKTEEKSLVQDIKFLNIWEQGNILKPKASGSVNADLPFIHISDLKQQDDRMEGLSPDQSLNQEPRSLQCSKVNNHGNLDKKNEHILKLDNQEKSKSPLPPPLPKSPSESWLWRTLPSISSQNSFSHSHFGTQFHSKKQGPKISSTGTK